jgi:D-glycero-D-manno-heptose 1,7-bisphosphate phosphatase
LDLVILDRDGVINHDSPSCIKSPEEWLPINGALEAIARLNHAGFRIVIATNQSGLGRTLFDIETLNRIHAKMQRRLTEVGGAVEAIFFCPHLPEDDCQCRKPRPGMLLEIAERLRISLRAVPVIGDSHNDIEAALAVGAHPILVETGNGRRTLESAGPLDGVSVFADLAEAADALISSQ